MSDQDILKPCPFCGGVNVTTFGPYGWYYQWGITHSCKAFYSGAQEMFKGFRTRTEAIAAWNTRATIPSSEGELLNEAIEALHLLRRNMRNSVTGQKSREAWAKASAVLAKAGKAKS